MSVHMEYCFEQLKNFDMCESDDEVMERLPNMQCLPDEMVKVIGSTKRSLLDSLEKADLEKGKFQEGAASKWGLVLSIRPNTRGHGDINIMDKAKAYQKKKNLEIPQTYKGNDDPEQDAIIDNMIDDEKLRCLQFVDLNPEIVLPDNLDVDSRDQDSPGDTIPNSKTEGVAVLVLDSPIPRTKRK
ncbi:hypothetical protein D1007_09373 [Hordeum vulgare]|nr:hypothetical protein D1007_09373 [Hordeum vulgare]